MIRRRNRKPFFPLLLFFVVLNALILTGKSWQQRWRIDQDVLIVGNALLFVVTLVSFLLAQRGVQNKNPHAFVRFVYGSVMIKLFACLIAAFVYIALFKKDLNKPALFICMGLYLVYTFLEVSALTKTLKGKTDG